MENVTDQPPEGEPSVTHYTQDADPQTWCGVSLTDPAVGDVTTDRLLATCPACTRQLVDEHLFDGAPAGQDAEPLAESDETDLRHALAADLGRMGLMPEPPAADEPAIRYGEYGNRQDEFAALSWLSQHDVIEHCHRVALMSNAARDMQVGFAIGYAAALPMPKLPVPEHTVGLEVLDEQLLQLAADGKAREMRELAREPQPLPEGTRVGVVIRVGGKAVEVPDVDTDWTHIRTRTGVLAELLIQAAYKCGRDMQPKMPTPDVLATLDGTPDATFWTADVQLRADQVAGGWLIIGWASEGDAALVTDIDECADQTCSWHACCTVITAGGAEPVHTPDFSDVTVRIPAAVTR